MKKSARKQTVLAKTKRARDAEIIPFDVTRYLTNEKRVAQYLDALVEARVPVLLTTFDSAKHLKSNKAIAAYLNDAFTDGTTDEILLAFFQVARARGMSRVAKAAGLSRENLSKALLPKSNARFVSIMKVARGLGVQISVSVA